MYKFAVALVLCCTTGHAQYAPAELFYQQNVQRATVGTIHEYVPGSSHNFQSPTGTTVQDRFPLTQPVLRSPTIQQSKAPQEATEEIKARYRETQDGYDDEPEPQEATEEIKARYQRELEVTLKHTRALKQRRANYNYGAKEDLDLQSVRMAIDFANSRTPAWPNWCPDWYPYTPVYPSFYCYYPFYGR